EIETTDAARAKWWQKDLCRVSSAETRRHHILAPFFGALTRCPDTSASDATAFSSPARLTRPVKRLNFLTCALRRGMLLPNLAHVHNPSGIALRSSFYDALERFSLVAIIVGCAGARDASIKHYRIPQHDLIHRCALVIVRPCWRNSSNVLER